MLSSLKEKFLPLLFIATIATLLACPALGARFATITEAPYVYYKLGYQVSTLDHCFEKGYIRPINPIRKVCQEFKRGERVAFANCGDSFKREYFLKMPILEVERLELNSGRFFTKVNRTQVHSHKVEIYRGDTLKEAYLFDIPACSESLITEPAPLITERKADPQEALVYGALLQKGIELIDAEAWSLEQVSSGSGYQHDRSKSSKSMSSATLWYTSPNCQQGEIVPVEVTPYLEALGGELTGSGRTLDGGELTGSGREIDSGRLSVRLNINQMSFSDLNFIQTRRFGIPHHLERYLSGEREIPKSLININCLNR